MLVSIRAFEWLPLSPGVILTSDPPEKGTFMRIILTTSLVLLLLAAGGATAAPPELKTEDQKTLYALGVALSQNLTMFNLSEAELELVKAGLGDGALRKPAK